MAVLLPVSLRAGEPEAYGKPLTLKTSVRLAEIQKNPEACAGKRVLIEGTIAEVCQKKGCWMTVSDGSATEPVQVKVGRGRGGDRTGVRTGTNGKRRVLR